MNSALLDTRSPYRTRRGPSASRVDTRPMETKGESVDVVLFWRLVHQLIRAPRRDRAAALAKVVGHIRDSRYPQDCVKYLLFECAADGGSDGLDIAIDALSQVGRIAAAAAGRFLRVDAERLVRRTEPRHHINDDVWYALLRGLCRSNVSAPEKINAVLPIVFSEPPGAKEAAAHALGDLAFHAPVVKQPIQGLLRQLADDASPAVRATAAEVLNDMEG